MPKTNYTYYLAALRSKHLSPILQPLPGEYSEYKKAFAEAVELLKITENTISILVYSDFGTCVNVTRDVREVKQRGVYKYPTKIYKRKSTL